MKELLKTYRNTLEDVVDQVERLRYMKSTAEGYCESEEDYKVLTAAAVDLEFVVQWLERGYRKDTHFRGIEKLDAYNLGEIANGVTKIKRTRSYQHAVDPYLMDYYIEDEGARLPFVNVIEEDTRTVEEKEQDEILDAKEKAIEKGLFIKLEEAQAVLSRDDIYMLLSHQQGFSQEEMGQELGITRQAVSKRIKSIRRKLESIGIERADL
ncbi:HTH domain-containing protein [Sporosarcina sp. FSL K6-1508]|uniref:HTH domain-containing protein n=1 Tax=Sporosarcina sp. FSL K6-1508 TaxID=2921553 RepID=UPI0030F51A54